MHLFNIVSFKSFGNPSSSPSFRFPAPDNLVSLSLVSNIYDWIDPIPSIQAINSKRSVKCTVKTQLTPGYVVWWMSIRLLIMARSWDQTTTTMCA